MADFIELFNRSQKWIDLSNWTISDANSTSSVFPSYLLTPNQYLILTDANDLSLFDSYDNVVGIENFPNLNGSSADSVIVRSADHQIVDHLYYENVPADGQTYELINPSLICSDENNLKPSSDPLGGTPGTLNTVHESVQDTSPPSFILGSFTDSRTLSLIFGEPLDHVNLSGSWVDYFTVLGNHLTVNSVEEFDSESSVTVQISEISDCQGNMAEDLMIDFWYDVSGPALLGLTILSESSVALIFSEPLKESTAENEQNYQLSGYTLQIARLQDTAKNRVHLEFIEAFDESEILELQILESQDTLGNLSSGFHELTYRDDVLEVEPLSSNIIEVSFKRGISSWHPESFLIPGIGNPQSIVKNDLEASVLLIYSESLKENKEYDLYMERISNATEVLSTPKREFKWDTKPPGLSLIDVPSNNDVSLTFDEPLEKFSATNVINYILNDTIHPEEVLIQDQLSVLLRFDIEFPNEVEQKLTFKNLVDQHGNKKTSKTSVEFSWDVKPPKLENAIPYNDHIIKIESHEPVDFGRLDPSKFIVNGVPSKEIEVIGPDSAELLLHFDQITQLKEAEIKIESWWDKRGNGLTQPIISIFNSRDPVITEVFPLDSQRLKVNFSKVMDYSSHNASVFEVNGAVPRSFENGIVGLGQSLKDSVHYNLHVQGAVSVEGYPLQKSHFDFNFLSYFDRWSLIDGKLLELNFLTQFEDIGNQNLIDFPDGVVFASEDEPNKIKVVFSKPVKPDSVFSVSWIGLIDKWNRRVPDNQIWVKYDTQAPSLKSVISDFDNTIQLHFDELLSEETVLGYDQYEIEGHILKNIGFSKGTYIHLKFDSLVDGHNYWIHYERISDLHGNYVERDSTLFTYRSPIIPSSREIIFSELMVDPSPAIGLPEVEYIELHNTSDTTFDLHGLLLSVNGKAKQLPEYKLVPGAYMILAGEPMADVETLLHGFTLTNSDGELRLMSVNGNLVDDVSYDIDWYKDPDKDDGGYSLEIINPYLACSSFTNWQASIDSTGGTPGDQNSVFDLEKDTVGPVLFNSYVQDNTLILNFNEAIRSSLPDIKLIGEQEFDLTSIVDQQTITIEFAHKIPVGKTFKIYWSDLADCSGNFSQDTVVFGKGKVPLFNELVISEVMPEPGPSLGLPDEEYLEIFNRTDEVISLDSIRLFDEASQSGPLGGIIFPGEFMLLTSKAGIVNYSRALGISKWPSLNNEGETIGISWNEKIIHTLTYSNEWYGDVPTEGVSLEMSDFDSPCVQEGNYLPSHHPLGGTPGTPNSVNSKLIDRVKPIIRSIYDIAADSLEVILSEQVNPRFNYDIQIDPHIDVRSWSFGSVGTDRIYLKLSDSLEYDKNYTLSFSYLVDCSFNFSKDQSKSFQRSMWPAQDLIISEILFNSRTGRPEFLEIHNFSNRPQKTTGLKIKKDGASSEILIREIMSPGEFYAFTSSVSLLTDDFPKGKRRNFIEVPQLVTFSDEGQSIWMVDSEGKVLDSIYYHPSFHSKLLDNTDGVSLERLSFENTALDSHNWQSASMLDDFGTPGKKNSHELQLTEGSHLQVKPKIFVPGNEFDGFVTIDFTFNEKGLNGKLTVHDIKGLQVRTLIKNGLLPSSGFVSWEGTDDFGRTLPPGHYILSLEIFGSGEPRSIHRQTVVIARDF